MNRSKRIPGAPIFLVGAQRSGTTALGVALSSAAAARQGTFTVNGKLLYYLRRWWLDDSLARHVRADEIIHSLTRRRPLGVGVDGWLLRANSALRDSSQRVADSSGRTGPLEEIRAICQSAYSNANLWGDKYNEYLLDLDFLHKAFPNAHYIFLAREPSTSVSSMMNWVGEHPWNPSTIEACALKWTHWNKQWLDFRETIPAERRIELLYDTFGSESILLLSALFEMDLESYLIDYRPKRGVCSVVASRLPTYTQEIWHAIRQLQSKTSV